MKTAVVAFSGGAEPSGKLIDEFSEKLTAKGLSLSAAEILSPSDDLGFKHCFEEFRDTVDNLIVLDGENCEFDLRQKIADFLDSPLFENETARELWEKQGGVDPLNYTMPLTATLIPNRNGAYQGFMTEDEQFTLAVLPSEKTQLFELADSVLIPYFSEKANIGGKVLRLRCFGNGKEIDGILKELKEKHGFTYFLSEENGDVSVTLVFSEDKNLIRGKIRDVFDKLSDYIYAEGDVNLSETLFTLLKLNGLKISVAESFTSGRVAAKIVENPGASSVFNEGIVCYSNKSKAERLGVNSDDIIKNGAVSSVVAYQMAAGLISGGNCDVALATTGLSGPESDESHKPVGLCYIAVGFADGVHTYKMNLKGGREKVTATAVNAALFFAVKNIKKRGNYNG